MKAKIFYQVTCPYCGQSQKKVISMNPQASKMKVVLCDIEDVPGCDRYFAVNVSLKPVVNTYSMEENF